MYYFHVSHKKSKRRESRRKLIMVSFLLCPQVIILLLPSYTCFQSFFLTQRKAFRGALTNTCSIPKSRDRSCLLKHLPNQTNLAASWEICKLSIPKSPLPFLHWTTVRFTFGFLLWQIKLLIICWLSLRILSGIMNGRFIIK